MFAIKYHIRPINRLGNIQLVASCENRIDNPHQTLKKHKISKACMRSIRSTSVFSAGAPFHGTKARFFLTGYKYMWGKYILRPATHVQHKVVCLSVFYPERQKKIPALENSSLFFNISDSSNSNQNVLKLKFTTISKQAESHFP